LRATDLYAKMAELSARGECFATITIIGSKGSSPRGLGAKMIVREDGSRIGTVGGDCFENDAVDMALQMLAKDREKGPEDRRAESVVAVRSMLLEEQEAGGVGMLCGGKVDILVELVKPELRVVVLGSGPVAMGIVELAHFLEMSTILVDPIPPLAGLPSSSSYVKGRHEESLEKVPVDPMTGIVIVTRHKNDAPALTAALKTRAGYIGMIGSRHRVQTILSRVGKETGMETATIASRVHAPIGLDIGASTPQEIAVSVLAEVLAHFRKGTSQSMALYAAGHRVDIPRLG
jgi:xanthine dehydrogenase accessory factor